jgi:glycosidase
MRFSKFLAAILVMSTVTGCGFSNESAKEKENKPMQMDQINSALKQVKTVGKNNSTYEIFVGSFSDSNNDGIGDLKGIENKLDYIKDLGCNEIWLTPICPSSSYHKYDVEDYKDIDPKFGTMSDFESLVKSCHKKGIKLITDMVINHTSDKNEWFRQASRYYRELKKGAEPDYKACKYANYYNFSRERESGYNELGGSEWYYESQFSKSMPDLNLDNDDVKAEISDIVKFWLDKGCDGFRCDAVAYYYKGNPDKNKEFMSWFASTVKEIKPDAYLVGEAWTPIEEYSSYYGSGFDSYFDFAFAGQDGYITHAVRGSLSAKTLGESLKNADEKYKSNDPNYTNGSFISNHDIARPAGYFAGEDGEKMLKLASGINLLRTGNSFVYYGDEIGMKGSGDDQNKRFPMRWGDSKITPENPDGYPDISMKYPNLKKQEKDPKSIYNYHKNALKLRNSSKAIMEGDYEVDDKLSGKNILALKKTYEDDSVYIVINTSSKAKKVDLMKSSIVKGKKLKTYGFLQASKGEMKLESGKLEIPEFGIVVLK